LDGQQAVTKNCGGYTIVNTGGIGGTGGWTGSDDDDPDDPGSSGGGNVPAGDHADLVTNLNTLDLIFDPFYGHVWYGFTEGHPEDAFEYRRMLRELMMSGLYGPDSYAVLRLQVALALPQAGGKPGSNNVIPTSSGELNNILVTRVGWEPYDRFLFNMNLGTGHDHAANYEPYFLQGLMNTEYGKRALEQAKRDYLDHRSLSVDAEILEYLMGTCSGCASP
jgi:hypothetical protein